MITFIAGAIIGAVAAAIPAAVWGLRAAIVADDPDPNGEFAARYGQFRIRAEDRAEPGSGEIPDRMVW